ncbi:MAG TPA: PDZ domain-containing protein [Gemmatimonadaceae bacterium]|nr:PDZ domain-containing protein [Gemmatimonadaceae bacterium]
MKGKDLGRGLNAGRRRARRTLFAAVALWCTTAPGSAAAQSVRARLQKADTLRDSAMVRVEVNAVKLQQMIREFLASREMEQAIGMSLKEAARGQQVDARRMKELADSMGRIARRNTGLMTQIEMQCTGEESLPAGYLGVVFDQQMVSQRENEPALYQLGTIETVQPGSPAERAGIRSGDVLLSIGGVDARKPIMLGTILKPGAKLQVRLQRAGTTKDVTVLIEKRPEGFGSDCATMEQLIAPERVAPAIMFHKFDRHATGTARPGAASTSPADVFMPAIPPGAFTFGFTTGQNPGVAGAILMPLDDDWRQSLGVDNGLLVIKVVLGSPAKDAGLRGNDVIISADGQTVGSVRALQRIISNARTNAVNLQVVRGGKAQTLTLRWRERER